MQNKTRRIFRSGRLFLTIAYVIYMLYLGYLSRGYVQEKLNEPIQEGLVRNGHLI